MDENKVIDQISKTLETTVDAKVKEVQTEVEDLKSEIKSLKATSVAKAENDNHKEVIVNIVKSVMSGSTNYEDAKNKALTEGTDGEGGEMVFDQFERDVIQVINEEPILTKVKVMNVKGDVLKLPKYTNGVVTRFEGETNGTAPSQGGSQYITFNIQRALTSLEISEELLRDSMTTPDIYEIIVRDIGESQANFLADKIINGVGEFEGILTNVNVGQKVLDTGKTSVESVGDSDLVAISTFAKRKFKRNKNKMGWIMSEYVKGKFMNIKTSTGMYLYPELRSENPTILGREVVLSDFAPVQDELEDVLGADFVIFGDLSYYVVAKNGQLEIESGYNGTGFNDNVKTVRSKSRVAGKVTIGEAFTKGTLASS